MKLTINNKNYGLQWGLGAIEIYCDSVGCDISDLDQHITADRVIDRLKAINNLSLAAMQNWCNLEKIDFDLTYSEFQSWLSDQPQDTANNIIEDWKASKHFGKTIGEYYFGQIPTEKETAIKKKQHRSAKS